MLFAYFGYTCLPAPVLSLILLPQNLTSKDIHKLKVSCNLQTIVNPLSPKDVYKSYLDLVTCRASHHSTNCYGYVLDSQVWPRPKAFSQISAHMPH